MTSVNVAESGILVAWQRCLNQFGIWQQLVATQSKDNERAVVNLRHLTDILSQHSEHVQGRKTSITGI